MANEEHLNILRQGVDDWNEWRKKNPETKPDLSRAYLTAADLRSAYLRGANLSGANLRGANLRGSYLIYANLSKADLIYANLSKADLIYANLSRADLIYADLSSAYLSSTNMDEAIIGYTVFGDNDLSEATGLESVRHTGPSTMGVDTLYKSGGKIPEEFLRGCGLRDWEIEAAKLYSPDLKSDEISAILYEIYPLRAHQAVQINPLFISYNHDDSPFVDKLEKHLNEKGIRFWRDVHHATAGRLEKQVDRAIRLNPTVLLVLSANSVKSDWVQHEVRLSRKLEIETGRDVLCPVALDDSWKSCKWPERLREQIMEYKILDFSRWREESFLKSMFAKLIEGLDLFYK